MNETKKTLYAETSEFDGTMFGEAYHVEDCDESSFEDYCENVMSSHWLASDSDSEMPELEDEQARPNSGIIAARQFTIPENDECEKKRYSMFLYENDPDA